jgi:hypothetical protein
LALPWGPVDGGLPNLCLSSLLPGGERFVGHHISSGIGTGATVSKAFRSACGYKARARAVPHEAQDCVYSQPGSEEGGV